MWTSGTALLWHFVGNTLLWFSDSWLTERSLSSSLPHYCYNSALKLHFIYMSEAFKTYPRKKGARLDIDLSTCWWELLVPLATTAWAFCGWGSWCFWYLGHHIWESQDWRPWPDFRGAQLPGPAFLPYAVFWAFSKYKTNREGHISFPCVFTFSIVFIF